MTNEEFTKLHSKLKKMRFSGMAKELENQHMSTDQLTADQRITRLIMAEDTLRYNKKVERMLKKAKLRYSGAAFTEDLYSDQEEFTEELYSEIKDLKWITKPKNIIVTGPTGTGKSYLASAVGELAVLQFHSVAYYRTNLLLGDLKKAEEQNRLSEKLQELRKVDVLILDDFGMMSLDMSRCRSIFELLDSREGRKPTIVVSQFPVTSWYRLFEDSTFADACLDRILHGALRVKLQGESKRKQKF